MKNGNRSSLQKLNSNYTRIQWFVHSRSYIVEDKLVAVPGYLSVIIHGWPFSASAFLKVNDRFAKDLQQLRQITLLNIILTVELKVDL